MAEQLNPFEGYTPPTEQKTSEPQKQSGGAMDTLLSLTPAGLLPSKEQAAKVLQSATFGFGADMAEVVAPGSGKAIRGLADRYDKSNPLSSLGIDLAVGAAQGLAMQAIPGVGQVAGAAKIAQIASNPLLRAAATGAGYGGLSGLGSGGSMEQRLQAAKSGAIAGGVTGPLIHGAVGAVAPMARRASDAMGITSAEQGAKTRIAQALDKEGKLGAAAPADARVVDVSPGVADLTKRATRVSGDTRKQAQEAAQRDVEGSQARIQAEKAAQEAQEPFMQQKQKLTSDLTSLQNQQSVAYDAMKQQTMPITPELQKIMDLPSVKEASKVASAQWNEAVQAGLLPKPKNWTPGKDLPMSGMDKLQRTLASQREAAYKGGNPDLGKQLDDIHGKLLEQMKNSGYSFKSAYDLSAQLGGVKRATDSAYDWGAQFSKGLSMADQNTFKRMSPLEQQHARLGFVNGMEDFLTNPKPMSFSQLNTAAKALESPEIRAVAGNDYARAMARRFRSEAQRQKTSAEFASPVINREEAEAGREATMGAYSVSKMTAAPLGQLLGLAAKLGMGEKEAQSIVNIATQPGGAQKLSQMGVNKELIEKARAYARARQFTQAAFANRMTGTTRTPSNAKE